MDLFDPGKLVERGFKVVALTFCMYFHYIVTMLFFFVPIDVAAKILLIPKMPAILIGCAVLWLWAMISAHLLLKSYERKSEKDEPGN